METNHRMEAYSPTKNNMVTNQHVEEPSLPTPSFELTAKLFFPRKLVILDSESWSNEKSQSISTTHGHRHASNTISLLQTSSKNNVDLANSLLDSVRCTLSRCWSKETRSYFPTSVSLRRYITFDE